MSSMPPPPPAFPPSGSQPFGGQPATMEHPKGTQVLVLGIVSLVCCYPLGIAALIIGGNARKEIAANPGVRYTNQTQITVGWVLGIVATVVFVIGLVYGASTL